MNNKLNSRFFSQVAEKMTRNRNVFGAALCVENGVRSVSWAGASGDINENDRYFIASVTKLCVSMFILHLRTEKRLDLGDRYKTIKARIMKWFWLNKQTVIFFRYLSIQLV